MLVAFGEEGAVSCSGAAAAAALATVSGVVEAAAAFATESAASTEAPMIALRTEDVDAMKVKELCGALKSLGLGTSGKRAELVTRLVGAPVAAPSVEARQTDGAPSVEARQTAEEGPTPSTVSAFGVVGVLSGSKGLLPSASAKVLCDSEDGDVVAVEAVAMEAVAMEVEEAMELEAETESREAVAFLSSDWYTRTRSNWLALFPCRRSRTSIHDPTAKTWLARASTPAGLGLSGIIADNLYSCRSRRFRSPRFRPTPFALAAAAATSAAAALASSAVSGWSVAAILASAASIAARAAPARLGPRCRAAWPMPHGPPPWRPPTPCV